MENARVTFCKNITKQLMLLLINFLLIFSILYSDFKVSILKSICECVWVLSLILIILNLIFTLIFCLKNKYKFEKSFLIFSPSIFSFIIQCLLLSFIVYGLNQCITLAECIFIFFNLINTFYGITKQSTSAIIAGIGFIVIGYLSIYYSTYGKGDNVLFNSLMVLFSSVIGGLLTLAGVAWTIKNQNEQKRDNDKEKAKPFFKFLFEINEEQETLSGYCYESKNSKNDHRVITFLKNSNLSVFNLKRLFHDNEWHILNGCLTVLQNELISLEFYIKNKNDIIILEIEDSLKEIHNYQLTILSEEIRPSIIINEI